MKKRDLVNKLKKAGFEFKREGTNHEVYQRNNDIEYVPRHREINDTLAKSILKKWGL